MWFAGDTGYRSFETPGAPVCPAFAEVGERFGGVDLALLPIGCVAAIRVGLCTRADGEGAVQRVWTA